MNISGMGFNPTQRDTATTNWLNVGIVYRYYNYKWVGFQSGLNYSQKGFTWNDSTRRYTVLEMPLLSQFHYEVWHLRFMINVGAYMSYALSAEQTVWQPDGSKLTSAYNFTDRDRRFEYGLHAGGGLSVVFDPLELQFEAGYQYALSYMMKPQYTGQPTMFTHFYELMFSVALLVRL